MGVNRRSETGNKKKIDDLTLCLPIAIPKK